MSSLPNEPSSLPPGSEISSPEADRLQRELAAIHQENRRREENRIFSYFPDQGPYRRALYPKHLQHFRMGAIRRERLFLAGMRVGKTLAGAVEMTYHLTGMYPPWWEGKRFSGPVRAVASGDTAKNTRDFIQHPLFGLPDDLGTGLIPKAAIVRTTPKHGLAEAYDTAYIRHLTGGVSRLTLKSYDQGVRAYYGTAEEIEWEDEDPPLEIHTPCLIRTMTTGGIVYVTLTPLEGRTAFIDEFLRTAVNREELEYR